MLKNPEPFVLFANFGPAALEFEIRVFLADVMQWQHRPERHPLRRFSMRSSREHIEIPSTPRAVVEVKQQAWPIDDDKIEAEQAEKEQAEAEAAAASKRLAKSARSARKPDPD